MSCKSDYSNENPRSDLNYEVAFKKISGTYRNVNRFSCPGWSNEETRFLMRYKLIHKKRISDSIHSWYYDFVEHHFLKVD